MKYYYADVDNTVVGPLPISALTILHRGGIISESTLTISTEGKEWIPFESVKESSQQEIREGCVPTLREVYDYFVNKGAKPSTSYKTDLDEGRFGVIYEGFEFLISTRDNDPEILSIVHSIFYIKDEVEYKKVRDLSSSTIENAIKIAKFDFRDSEIEHMEGFYFMFTTPHLLNPSLTKDQNFQSIEGDGLVKIKELVRSFTDTIGLSNQM